MADWVVGAALFPSLYATEHARARAHTHTHTVAVHVPVPGLRQVAGISDALSEPVCGQPIPADAQAQRLPLGGPGVYSSQLYAVASICRPCSARTVQVPAAEILSSCHARRHPRHLHMAGHRFLQVCYREGCVCVCVCMGDMTSCRNSGHGGMHCSIVSVIYHASLLHTVLTVQGPTD